MWWGPGPLYVQLLQEVILGDPPMRAAVPQLCLSDVTCWSAPKSPLPTPHPIALALCAEGWEQRAGLREKFWKDTRVWGQESQPLGR